MSLAPVIVWFRNDLRVSDHPALHAACESGAPVLPVYLHGPEDAGDWAPGAASRYWRHYALDRLAAALDARGAALLLASGPAASELPRLVRESGASAVYWNRRYEPHLAAIDRRLATALREDGVEPHDFPGNLLVEPWSIATGSGQPYKVYTPFSRTWFGMLDDRPPLPAPGRIAASAARPASLALDELGLRPSHDWADGIHAAWKLDEDGASEFLQTFLDGPVEQYDEQRDRPDEAGVSRLSPFLHAGELSPREARSALLRQVRDRGQLSPGGGAQAWLKQLCWREFAHHLLWHFPHTSHAPLREAFERFPWREAEGDVETWARGRTGYPLVDAGMRELWATGYMHNRVRMVAASFLVKHLRVHWLTGALWFWDTLVDADLANNTMGWQWVAGSGADAAPYFRIFNPVAQGERFDGGGRYVRRWVPEIARLPDKWLHQPWNAPAAVLSEAGVRLGETYPAPMVDHAEARRAALDAYQAVKSGG